MTHDLHTLVTWIRIVALVAAVCTSTVPILYVFFPWRTRLIGRLFMLQALAFAAAMDLTALFSYWHTQNVLLVFWIDAVVLTAISVATSAFTVMMWRVRPPFKKKGKKDAAER